MKLLRKYKKVISIFLFVSFFLELLSPLKVLAITGQSNMPEYRSFEPVATTNMVNNFDGSLTYNIPLLEVPNGYPMSLSYHSNDINNEALASWVGLGWTLNPGSINRVKRGFPDDNNGNKVEFFSRMEANWTIGAGIGLNAEIFGDENLVDLNLGASIRYNNYNGIGTSITAGLGLAGMVSMNFSYTNGRFGFDPEVNPAAIFQAAKAAFTEHKNKPTSDQKVEEKKKPFFHQSEKQHAEWIQKNIKSKSPSKNQVGFNFSYGALDTRGSKFSVSSFAPTTYPTTVSIYSGIAVHLNVDIGLNILPLPIAPEGSLEGSYVRQKNEESRKITTYGYMNSESASEDGMMDYLTENDTPFEKRDNILGIPLPNNDIYNLTGEAMGGSFRPFRSEYGHYKKNKVQSESFSIQVGADVKIASIFPCFPPIQITNLVYSAGLDLGGEYQTLTVSDWDSGEITGDEAKYSFKTDDDFKGTPAHPNASGQKFALRFNGDLAGNFDQVGPNNDGPMNVTLSKNLDLTATPVYSGFSPNTGIRDLFGMPGGSTYPDHPRVGQSTFVDYNTNNDLSSSSPTYKSFQKNLKVINSTGTAAVAYSHTGYNNNAIGEFNTYNADGVSYTYGLPIYTRNENDLQYSLEDAGSYTLNPNGLIATVSGSIEGSANRKLGTVSKDPYATTYLLTQITSPDYVDRGNNGPDAADFGNYTKFSYQQMYGGSSDWYPYRSPYEGVSFSHGTLSVRDDDMGSFSYGEKEVYYLKAVESKTHVAIFKLEDRDDGLSSPLSNGPGYDDMIRGGNGATKKTLKKLTQIDLYAIKDLNNSGGLWTPKSDAVPIKTIHFEYETSSNALCGALPNSATGGGKLTLKKVWFEYNGKLTSKISPYVFTYTYPSVSYPGKYAGFGNYMSGAVGNENYNVLNSDRWGNYRSFSDLSTNLGSGGSGNANLARFFPFVNQNPGANFDPAMWCLKKITLPSGGEIHVQYEQNDYYYVQDKKAMVMVPLHNSTGSGEMTDGKKYYLDIEKMGVSFAGISPTEQESLVREMFEPMNVEKKRIYFNFLYAMLGSTPSFTSTYSDYLEGFARISGFGLDNGRPYFKFKSDEASSGGGSNFYQKIEYSSEVSKRELPREVCLDFYKSQRRGKISGEANALSSAEKNGSGSDLVKAFANLLSVLTNSFSDKCAVMDPNMSFVRVQIPHTRKMAGGVSVDPGRKLGGGVRVKRLLMYDAGIAAGDPAVLYGQEYKYTTTDVNGRVISSGVASNEPSVGRRENALVNPIDKDEQSKLNAFLFGRDMYSQEGPLGETLLPAPAVGYSKVTISNIHTGRTSTGYEEHEFYTWKDFPFRADRTTIDEAFKTKLGVGLSAGPVSASYSRENPYMSQGYAFVTNAMNGQPKRSAKYAIKSEAPMSEEIYEYFKQGDQIKYMDENISVQTADFSQFGKESEVLSERRQVADVTVGGNIGVDLTGGASAWYVFIAIIPIPTFVNSSVHVGFHLNERILHTHVTSKIISYPAIVKKVTNITDGVRNVTENMILDKYTGKPVVVKSYDDFKGTYLNEDFMASWSYQSMRSKAINQKLVTSATLSSDANGLFLSTTPSGLKRFAYGDLLELKGPGTSTSTYALYASGLDAVNNRVRLSRSQYYTATPTAGTYSVTVIKSGYTNELNTKMGNILLHSENNNPQPITAIPTFVTGQPLVAALNAKLPTLTPTAAPNNVFTLNGTFPDLDMSNYAQYMPADCKPYANRMTLSSVKFRYDVTNTGALTLTLLAFKTSCSNKNLLITCEGGVVSTTTTTTAGSTTKISLTTGIKVGVTTGVGILR